jgi:glucose/arabinose dehydrogenase
MDTRAVPLRRIAALAAAVAMLHACGGGGGDSAPAPVPAPPPAPGVTPAVNVGVTEKATTLSNPWGLAFLPDGRILVTERGGRLKLLSAGGAVLGDIAGVPPVDFAGQGGLLDVVVDPAFASNRRIYMSFSEGNAALAQGNGTAVMRGVLDAQSRTLSDVTVIYRQLPKVRGSTSHFGSRLVFDQLGHLFVTLGDREAPAERVFAQDLARGNGKVARVTTEGGAAPGNPAWNVQGAQPELWSLGHRNPQGAALHPVTGELWASEHGPQGGDEINRVLAGRNYGWPLVSHGQEYGTTTPVGPVSSAGMENPLWVWETIDGRPWTGGAKSSTAPAGMAFYNGTAVPQWQGSLFVGALAGQALWRLTLEGNAVVAQERLLGERGERIRDVEQGPDGALYLLTDNGKLLRYGAP